MLKYTVYQQAYIISNGNFIPKGNLTLLYKNPCTSIIFWYKSIMKYMNKSTDEMMWCFSASQIKWTKENKDARRTLKIDSIKKSMNTNILIYVMLTYYPTFLKWHLIWQENIKETKQLKQYFDANQFKAWIQFANYYILISFYVCIFH